VGEEIGKTAGGRLSPSNNSARVGGSFSSSRDSFEITASKKGETTSPQMVRKRSPHCDSGVGKLQEQEGVYNLVETFLSAGSKPVVGFQVLLVDTRQLARVPGRDKKQTRQIANGFSGCTVAGSRFVPAGGNRATEPARVA
jgi:hypothetical protein